AHGAHWLAVMRPTLPGKSALRCRSQMHTALRLTSSRLSCYASLCARSMTQRDCLTALSPGPRKSARQIPFHLLLEIVCSSFIFSIGDGHLNDRVVGEIFHAGRTPRPVLPGALEQTSFANDHAPKRN